jgi:hypothetical protein
LHYDRQQNISQLQLAIQTISAATHSIADAQVRTLGRLEVPKGSSTLALQDPAIARCELFCSCRCHVRIRTHSPRWLDCALGVLFIQLQLSGTPLFPSRPSCNSPTCRSAGGSIRLEYAFSVRVLSPWILSFSATSSRLDGIGGTWSLRAPDLVPHEAAGVYRLLCDAESPEAVERFMDSVGISGRAVNPRWDMSLLHVRTANVLPLLFFFLFFSFWHVVR